MVEEWRQGARVIEHNAPCQDRVPLRLQARVIFELASVPKQCFKLLPGRHPFSDHFGCLETVLVVFDEFFYVAGYFDDLLISGKPLQVQ